ncbi:MAG TPA: class I SAM-dependent methyltransferase [Thermoanaerobaculia bacterium]|nr:class I SAM-dependent methyltransferase [Thermoanaerobaculia bacterium]
MPSIAARQNEQYYSSLSPGREDYWRYMAAPRFRVRTILSLLSGRQVSSVIDLGCGSGELLGEIRAVFPAIRLAGIDLSLPQIEINRLRDPTTDWYAGDLENPEAVSSALFGAFDVVVASEIIEHLDHSDAFLRVAHLLARPENGMLIVTTQSGPVRATERAVGHRHHYSAEEMAARLIECGWQPLRIWNAGYPFHDLSKWYANRDPAATLDRFGTGAWGWRERAIAAALRLAFRLNSNSRGAQLFALARAH